MTQLVVPPYQPYVGEQLACSRRRGRDRVTLETAPGCQASRQATAGGGKLLPYAFVTVTPVTASCSRLIGVSPEMNLRVTPGARADSMHNHRWVEGTACRAPANGNQPRPSFLVPEALRRFSPGRVPPGCWVFQPGVSEP